MAQNEVTYGDKDILAPGELDPKNAKVAISIRLDGDLLLAYRKAAKEKGIGYQTLINDVLRVHLEGVMPIEQRLARMQMEFQEYRKQTEAKMEQFESRIQSILPVQPFLRLG